MLSWNDQTPGNDAKRPDEKQTERTAGTDSSFIAVSNHEFMAALFGESFGSATPLVCCKPGNPVLGGYTPRAWPVEYQPNLPPGCHSNLTPPWTQCLSY